MNILGCLARGGGVGLTLLVLGSVEVSDVSAQSLGGSSRSLDLQNRQAEDHDFTYLGTATQVRRFVDAGYLVPIRGNADFELHEVSFPYGRPESELFVRRLAAQYRGACDEKLVITSLTRPQNRQPRNASDRSVHPTGMAIDLRRSSDRNCRAWLESVLLDLESQGVLEATRERSPAHYHIALFPEPYADYVETMTSRAAMASASSPNVDLRTVEYRVRTGDSLWTIAKKHGITVEDLQDSNDLSGSRIYAGQVIEIPQSR